VLLCNLRRYDRSGKTGHASTPEQLDAVMHEIGSDKQRYEAMLAWKTRKVRPSAWRPSGLATQCLAGTDDVWSSKWQQSHAATTI
jgi:hypothetical protein